MSTESLMTDAATPEGTGSQTVATTTEAQAPAAAATNQQQATEGTTTDASTTGEGGKTEGKTEVSAEKPAGAPEKYEDFKAPEGAAFDAKVIEQFSEVAKELNMPQEAAQKMLDKVAPVLAARQAEQMEAARNAWADASKTDKEFGGDHLDANLAVAKKALDTFGSPELRTLLNQSGLGNHPEVIRMMVKAGKAISEDKVVTGGADMTPTGSAAKVLYPNQ